MKPLAPAIMEVEKSGIADKYMTWPLNFAAPGEAGAPAPPPDAVEKAGEGQWRTCRVIEVPASIVAVREFADASMGPVVRRADRELRECLERDGLVRFGQYDAIFSMGKRRGGGMGRSQGGRTSLVEGWCSESMVELCII